MATFPEGLTQKPGVSSDKGIYTRQAPEASISAFGEKITAENVPVVECGYSYQLVSQLHVTNAQAGGSLVVQNGFAEASSGASANGLGSMQSARFIKYRPGQGVMARFTTLFDTPTALSTQTHGLSNAENGLFVGHFFSTAFSFIYAHDGAIEIQKLTITTGSSNTENITITLDDVAVADVAVTNTGVTTSTAWEIEQHDWSTVGDIGYEVHAEGADVYFVRLRADTVSGSFAISGTSVVGSFSQIQAGTEATFDVTLQSDFNQDTLDGTGDENNPSGMLLDPAKLNVYQIQYQFLGGGGMQLFIEGPEAAQFVPVHTIEFANTSTTPSLTIPSMAISLAAFAASAGNDVTVKTSSEGGFTQGPRILIGPQYGAKNTVAAVTTTLTPILSVRGRGVYANKVNFSEALMETISFAAAALGNKPVEVEVILNGTLNNTANFTEVDSDSAFMVDTTATTITGGQTKTAFTVAETGGEVVDVSMLNIFLNRRRTMTLAANSTVTTAAVSAGFGWVEDV